MNDLFFIVWGLSLIAIVIFIALASLKFIKKEKVAGKKQLRNTGISLVVMIASFAIFISTVEPSSESDNELVATTANTDDVEKEVEVIEEPKETKEERDARYQKEIEEKAIADQKAKEEAEAKLKDEEEARIKAEKEEKARQEQLVAEQAAKKASAQTIDYAHLKKNPDRYKGEYVKYTGEIIQILEGNGMTNIRLAVTKTSYGYDFNDVIFIEYDGYTDYVDGDIITMYGEVYGTYSYESQAGFNISLPGVIAKEFE